MLFVLLDDNQTSSNRLYPFDLKGKLQIATNVMFSRELVKYILGVLCIYKKTELKCILPFFYTGLQLVVLKYSVG